MSSQIADFSAHRDRARHLLVSAEFFPDDASLVRLAGMLCIEVNDEWLVGRRYLSAESTSLVMAGRDDHTHMENKEDNPQLQAA